MTNTYKPPTDDIVPEYLEFIINHVFLLPQLPQEEEENTGEKNSALLKLVRRVAETYHQNTADPENSQWVPIVQMLTTLCVLENGSSLPAQAFRDAIVGMKAGGNYAQRPINWSGY